MEDFALDVMIGKGPSARSLRLSLKPFTIVGATTRAGRISQPAARPLRGHLPAGLLRRGGPHRHRACARRGCSAWSSSPDGAAAIARRGRGTPRVVNRLLRRVRDYAQIHGDGRVDAATADKALAALEIDDEGLDGTDRKLLAAIVQKFGSGPVGVQALAAVLAEEPETVEDVYEPFLLRLGFLDRTPQGRIATDGARQHLARLGFEVPPPRRGEPEQPALWDGTADPDAPAG